MNQHKLAGLVFSMAVAGCVAPNPQSRVVALQQQATNETKPISASPRQTLVGRWINPEFGGTMTFNSNGSFDLEGPGFSLKSPSADNNIPAGMYMGNGVLSKGKSSWNYEGDSKRGKVFMTLDDYQSGEGLRMNGDVIFINDSKLITMMDGKASYVIKIK